MSMSNYMSTVEVKVHIEVNFNWSGKQSLSTGVELKNRGGRDGGKGELSQGPPGPQGGVDSSDGNYDRV